MLSFLRSLDHALFNWITTFHTSWLDTVMLAASHLGAGGFVWLAIAGILFLFPERRAAAWRVALAIGLASFVVNGLVKPLIWRDRPYVALASAHAAGGNDGNPRAGGGSEGNPRGGGRNESDPRAEGGNESDPRAGGATSNTVRVIDAKPRSSSFPSGHAANAVAGAMALSQALPAARVVWWLIAATIALSRIYVGVHFPIDVLAGALIGLLCARLVLGRVKPQHAPFETGPVGGG